MINFIINKIFGTRNERELKKLIPTIEAINHLEKQMESHSDEELKHYTTTFRERLKNEESLDDLLVEAFAVVREVGKRVLDMRHFDVQLMGGIVLHQGKITEMKTGEGKTLVATLAAYLNALKGQGVHIVTVNDYLAKRDSVWMGGIYKFLGLTVGTIQHDIDETARKEAYDCDILYGTNNEFGFDYLRDNMKFEVDSLVQRKFNYGIVDEVDSILIDEARTPLIISGPTEESTSFYYSVNDFVKRAKRDPENYELDEKTKTVVLTEKGIEESERFFKIENLYDLSNMDTLHQIYQALKAHLIFRNDVDYLVKEGQVLIVDEFTGRVMPGRRYSDGLHQALEAKENVKIEQEYQTLATITFQNYFRMYDKLAGMTGTAMTEAAEFASIYNLDSIKIPTNEKLIRIVYPDVIYGSKEEKWDAAVNEIRELHQKGQPALVGTISIENSETLSRRLRKEKIPHVVLNAKYHEQEAEIIAQAGRIGAVTLATNMAGRGTDILLGGNPEALLKEELNKKNLTPDTAPEVIREKIENEIKEKVKKEHEQVIKLGGLHILGTERHEARRIDNQLRGRSGRQGDPGSSRFYISLEDDLMKILGTDRIKGLLVRAGMSDGVPIENRLVSRAIENAQKQIESQNFSIRKHLLEYDDVMNKQRQAIYSLRKDILMGKDFKTHIETLTEEIFDDILKYNLDENKSPDEWDYESFQKEILSQFGKNINEIIQEDYQNLPQIEIRESILNHLKKYYQEKEILIGTEQMRELERMIMLQIIDSQWKDHLLNVDHLKEGIGLRGYAQKDPLIEYKKESFHLFEELQTRIDDEIIKFLYLFHPVEEEEIEEWKKRKKTKLSRPASKMPRKKRKKKKKKRR
ncbi:MAG: preprotein translocase subunit SecA [Candidatus Aminicenantes bacterium]|nr:preprotein translocase subunit SecA [Candidatus Aminicenantes bacterium]